MIMKKLDTVLTNNIVRVLQDTSSINTPPARNTKAISADLLREFYGKHPACITKCQDNALLPSGLSAELKRLVQEDYNRLYLSIALLMTLIVLTVVEFALLAISKIFVIPILFTSNLGLLLLGYIACEYKHIMSLERDHDICIQNRAVIDDFHAFLQEYNVDEGSDVTKEDLNKLLSMIDSLRIQARSNGYQ